MCIHLPVIHVQQSHHSALEAFEDFSKRFPGLFSIVLIYAGIEPHRMRPQEVTESCVVLTGAVYCFWTVTDIIVILAQHLETGNSRKPNTIMTLFKKASRNEVTRTALPGSLLFVEDSSIYGGKLYST